MKTEIGNDKSEIYSLLKIINDDGGYILHSFGGRNGEILNVYDNFKEDLKNIYIPEGIENPNNKQEFHCWIQNKNDVVELDFINKIVKINSQKSNLILNDDFGNHFYIQNEKKSYFSELKRSMIYLGSKPETFFLGQAVIDAGTRND